ncbi:MAG: CAP domain-containing protein [Spirochaetes bacterium]|nr:CAP domain-containing protein [Spirochaetota bacterium]
MRQLLSFLFLFSFLVIVTPPGVSQELVQIQYYSNTGNFTVNAPPKINSYYLLLRGTIGDYRSLVITMQKRSTSKQNRYQYGQENPGDFRIKYLFPDGPGEYTVTIYGSSSASARTYKGICTFTTVSEKEVPEEAKREEREELEEKLIAESKEAFEYLNRIRSNPPAYSNEIGVNLRGIDALPPLIWDDRLAESAKKRAEDMAIRNYFNHVNPEGIGPNHYAQQQGYRLPPGWTDKKASNFIESISAGHDKGVNHIKNLIHDNGAGNATAGHRIHLLGMNPFFADHKKVGIAMVLNPNSTYRYYFVVHTAPQEQ